MSQNEEEYLTDIVTIAFCQLSFPKLVFMGWGKILNQKKGKS